MKTRIFLLIIASLFMLTTIGCVGEKAFTKMARTGDTVMLALGGSPSHEINSRVDKNNMQVKIKDSAGDTHDVTLRYLFKTYSDPSNRYNYNATYERESGNYISRYYIDPYQGEWVAVVDLADPSTGDPLPLAEGTAEFQVTTPDLVNSRQKYYGGIPSTDGYLSTIPISILPGTGSPHSFNKYGDPIDLEPLPQVEINFDNSAITLPYPDDTTKIGGIQFTLDYDETYFDQKKFPPMILDNINEPRINVFVSKRIIDDNKVIKVMILPQYPGSAILANDDPDNTYLKAKIKDMKMFVVWDPTFVNGAIDASNYDQVFQITDYKVVDKNGVPLEDGSGNPLITLVTEPHMN